MIFAHMLQQSSDSLIAAALLSPFLTARQRVTLIVGLGLWDGLASFYGPFLVTGAVSTARIELLAELPVFLVAIWAVTSLIVYRKLGWAVVAFVPIALAFDNLVSGLHPVTAICSAGFGSASALMGVAGVAIGLIVKRGWKAARA